MVLLGEGDNIGKLLIMEFTDDESVAFADIMNMLQRYPDFCKYTLKDEVILSLPCLEIRPERRKIYSNFDEISMTKKGEIKEFTDILDSMKLKKKLRPKSDGFVLPFLISSNIKKIWSLFKGFHVFFVRLVYI